ALHAVTGAGERPAASPRDMVRAIAENLHLSHAAIHIKFHFSSLCAPRDTPVTAASLYMEQGTRSGVQATWLGVLHRPPTAFTLQWASTLRSIARWQRCSALGFTL